MSRFTLTIACISMVVAICGPARAAGERPYWPAYEIIEVPEGCIRWNWQQGSYYNYCPRVRGVAVKVKG